MAAVANASGSAQDDQVFLAQLRNATAKYHDIGQTLGSGRVDLHLCVDHMGQHYAQPPFDANVDPLNPEAMVYADDGTGHLRLVAVEWVATEEQHVFGQHSLHFNPAVGLWVLHAWIWAPNPDGVWSDMNPRIGDCP
jgi:hypothetical protein